MAGRPSSPRESGSRHLYPNQIDSLKSREKSSSQGFQRLVSSVEEKVVGDRLVGQSQEEVG